jgi:hypothetical protein
MNFDLLLDKLLGQREIIHEVECGVCGDFASIPVES